jgi:hypothetical protein
LRNPIFGRALALAIFLSLSVWADEVPVDVQMALFTMIWKLDRTLPPAQSLTVAIVYQETNRDSARAFASVQTWLHTKSIRAVGVPVDGDAGVEALQSVEANIFYVTPMRGVDITRIAAIARSRRVRTMAARTEYVGLGLSVGIGSRNDRPLILINLQAARAEGASYQAQLLKLAEIINR